jgi:hypothetical protein
MGNEFIGECKFIDAVCCGDEYSLRPVGCPLRTGDGILVITS